jgi:hypothetical protein
MVFGSESTYGLDWQSDITSQWEKRSIVRVITGVPAGAHNFIIQTRAQSNGNRHYIHSGNCAQYYSGFNMFMQELK